MFSVKHGMPGGIYPGLSFSSKNQPTTSGQVYSADDGITGWRDSGNFISLSEAMVMVIGDFLDLTYLLTLLSSARNESVL